MTPTIVDATSLDGTTTDVVVVRGQAVEFHNTLKQNGSTYDLSGKTVQATIRLMSTPTTVVSASLEDVSVALANDETTAAAGGVTLALSAALTALLTYTGEPVNPWHEENWLLQYHVTDDDFYPDMLRFKVRPALD